MKRIAATDGGTYYHFRALREPPYACYFTRLIDIRALRDDDLADVDVLVVTCRTHAGKLRAAAPGLLRFLGGGGTVVAMGETQAHTWLPGVRWTYRPADFWWWLSPGADSGLRLVAPAHPLFAGMTLAEATWHYHGVFDPPLGARSIIDHAAGGSVLYDDDATTAGRLIVTSLDPFYHHGSNFMPAASRFLAGFLPWLANDCA